MTLEYRSDQYGNVSVITTACALCGAPIAEQQGMCDHLPHCPALPVYATRGSLRDPDLAERVREALATELEADHDHDVQLLADGGGESDGV